jgi:anaerobic selenocysteine-containing dehydrogenase
MQANRAICCLYSLTGQFDARGSNVIFATPPTNSITGRDLLPREQVPLRLGSRAYPLGPQTDPGIVQAAEVYEAILTGRPYPVKAMVLFGSDPLLGHGDPLRGKAALAALDFYVHIDMIANPSAQFADLLLPAASCWEREALMPSFDIAEDTMTWMQLRAAVIAPRYESRPDIEIIFDLAQRLELGEQFFNGNTDAALNFQLAPCGLTVEQLRQNPGGTRYNMRTEYQKYAEIDPQSGQPRGFDTPSRRIELYATRFAEAGYAALPNFQLPAGDSNATSCYPLTLTFFRLVQFCDEQHRNIPRLRRTLPEPFLEIHSATAKAEGIEEEQWIFLQTASGQVKLKAKFNDSLDREVVATTYGWWQPCKELNHPGYDPFQFDGGNTNLLIPNNDVDAISASVAHRSQKCRVKKCLPG